MNSTLVLYIVGAAILVYLLRKAQIRLQLSRAKHRSLAGHSKWSRRLARLIPFYEYSETEIFSVDGAPAEIAAKRREGFMRLAALFNQRFAKTAAATQTRPGAGGGRCAVGGDVGERGYFPGKNSF